MNKREYLRSLGFAVGDRGRFSAEMKAAIAKAESEGTTFDVPVITESDNSKVRSWAKENGIPVGVKGRIPDNIVKAYNDGNVNAVKDKPKIAKSAKITEDARTPKEPEPLYSRDTKFVHTFPDNKRVSVSGKEICRQSGISLRWCHCGNHTALIGFDFLPVSPIGN